MTTKATLIRFATLDEQDRINTNGKPYRSFQAEVEDGSGERWQIHGAWYKVVANPRANGPVRTVQPAMTPATEPLDYDKLAAAMARALQPAGKEAKTK